MINEKNIQKKDNIMKNNIKKLKSANLKWHNALTKRSEAILRKYHPVDIKKSLLLVKKIKFVLFMVRPASDLHLALIGP